MLPDLSFNLLVDFAEPSRDFLLDLEAMFLTSLPDLEEEMLDFETSPLELTSSFLSLEPGVELSSFDLLAAFSFSLFEELGVSSRFKTATLGGLPFR